jgi:hypothetical protein
MQVALRQWCPGVNQILTPGSVQHQHRVTINTPVRNVMSPTAVTPPSERQTAT